MSLNLISQTLGGLGIVLLGMQLLSQGLKSAAGPSMKRLISRATESNRSSFLTGVAVTGLVQSSSAVSLATLGFVSAGLMSLGQALPLLFGSNIGTTLTGWIVTLLGFKLDISELALPLIGVGVGLKLFAGQRPLSHYGSAIAGFGLFFFGLDFVRLGLDSLSDHLPLEFLGDGVSSLLLSLLAGLVITTLTQSSSATMVVALSMIATNTLGFSASCALIVGANIGTTTTAMIGALGSTPNAKRVALAHFVFNTQTAVLGTILLLLVARPLDQHLLEYLDPVVALALFHTLFNLVGVILIWPVRHQLEHWLNRKFIDPREANSRPQFISSPLLTTPSLAVEGINRELARVSLECSELARAALSSEGGDQTRFIEIKDSIQALIQQIYSFNQELARRDITAEVAETLPVSIRVGRYLSEIARLAVELQRYQPLLDGLNHITLSRSIAQFKQTCVGLLDACEVNSRTDVQGVEAHQHMRQLNSDYQNIKREVLDTGVQGAISTEECAQLLDYLSNLRRMAGQAEDVSSHWSSTLPVQHRSQLTDETQPG